MKHKRIAVLAILITVGAVAYAFAPESLAQSQEVVEMKKILEARIMEKRTILSDARSMMRWLLASTILIVVLGAASAAVQGFEKRWVKSITVVLGLAIAVLTSIVDIVFDTDYRTLKTTIIETRQRLDDARMLVADIHLKDESTARGRAIEVQKILAEISGMEKKLTVFAFSIDLLPVAYAQRAPLPAWAQSAPGSADQGTFFQFAGRGEDPDLAKARDRSINEAVERAASALVEQRKAGKLEQLSPAEANAIRAYVRRSATTAETHLAQDPSGRFQVHTLIKLDKSFLAPEVVRIVLPPKPEPVKVGEPQLLKWRHRVLLGGELDKKVALYAGDVRPDTNFRVVVYVPKADAPVLKSVKGTMATSAVFDESETVLLNRHVDPKTRNVEFSHNQRTYRVAFDVVGKESDQLKLEVFRIR